MGISAKKFGKNKSIFVKAIKNCKTTKEQARQEIKSCK